MAPLREAFHWEAETCKYLLDSAVESTKLKIGESEIARLGSGLMADRPISQGRLIYKSKPLLACVDPGIDSICHYCLKGSTRVPLAETPKDEPSPGLCGGCRRARFCSKTCHAKAWKLFHRNECKILRDSPNLVPSHLALYRLLFWKKDNFISTKVATTLRMLDDHFDEYSDSQAGDTLFEYVTAIRNTANSTMALHVVLRLLPGIQVNAIKMRQAEKSGSFGIALDLLSCTVNHSCDPNAFLFVEDGHVICRSLRDIAEGEEVTISYGDPMLPLNKRREYLKAEYFFTCFCKRCEVEKRELKTLAGGNNNTLKTIHAVQDMLVQVMNNTVAANNKPGQHKEFENLEKMEMDIQALTARAMKHRSDNNWPDHLDPMPLVRTTLATLHLNKGNHFPATRNSLRGTLLCRSRNGPDWVNNLCTLTLCLAAIAAGRQDEPHFTSGSFLTLKETQCAVRGYGMRLCKDAGVVFGGTSAYTEFLCDWFSWVCKTAEPPKPGSDEFKTVFWEVQKKLLAWADIDVAYCVDPGTELPDSEGWVNSLGKLTIHDNVDGRKEMDGEGEVDQKAEGATSAE